MKNTIRGIIFWTIALAFILIMFAIGQALANLLTMNFIMAVVYIALGFSFIYILKNQKGLKMKIFAIDDYKKNNKFRRL